MLMGEKLNFYYANDQPIAEFEYDDDIYDLNWENTTVYLHHPPYAQIDHLFVTELDEETTAVRGIYMFRQTIDNFTQVAKQLVDLRYRVVKAPIPIENDLKAWVTLNTRDLDE